MNAMKPGMEKLAQLLQKKTGSTSKKDVMRKKKHLKVSK